MKNENDMSMSAEEGSKDLENGKSHGNGSLGKAEDHKVSMETAMDQTNWQPSYQAPEKPKVPRGRRGTRTFKPIGPEAERKHRKKLTQWADFEAIALILQQSSMLADLLRKTFVLKCAGGTGFVIGVALGYYLAVVPI